MNQLKVVKDQHLIIGNKNYTKQARIEGELNQKFQSRKREKWRQFGETLDSNFPSIQTKIGQNKPKKCSNNVNKWQKQQGSIKIW